MKMSNKLYDVLNKVQRWLPALGILYLALCQIWGFPYGQAVNNTILAVAAFLATTLEISTGIYHKDVTTQILVDGFSGAFDSDDSDEPSEDVPGEDDPADAE